MDRSKPCALFFDFDGTLAHESIVSAENQEALRRAQAAGHYTVLNTGRPYSAIPQEVKEMPFDGFIAGSAHVRLHGKVLLDNILPAETLRHIVQLSLRSGISCTLEGVDSCYMLNRDDGWCPCITDSWEEFLARPARELHITKAAFHADMRQYADAVPGCHLAGTAEYLPLGFDKDTGIAVIGEALGIPVANRIAFGDGPNDLAAMAKAGVRVVFRGDYTPPEMVENATLCLPVGTTAVAQAIDRLLF